MLWGHWSHATLCNHVTHMCISMHYLKRALDNLLKYNFAKFHLSDKRYLLIKKKRNLLKVNKKIINFIIHAQRGMQVICIHVSVQNLVVLSLNIYYVHLYFCIRSKTAQPTEFPPD